MSIHQAQGAFTVLAIGAGVLVIPVPARAQAIAPINLGGIAGEILNASPSSNAIALNNGGIFSGISAGDYMPSTIGDTVEGILGGTNTGGIFGAANPVGQILGGTNTGDDLLTVIQGFISNIDRLVRDPLGFIAQIFQGGNSNQSPLGETLANVEEILKRNQSAMGLPDLAQSKAEVWQANTATNPFSAIDLFHLKQGQVTSRITQGNTQTILGKDGQQLQIKGMQAVQKSITGARQVVPASGQVAQQTTQFAQQAGQVAQTAGEVAQQSTQTAAQVNVTAGKIKAAISTQDAIKGLGEQNAQTASIFAGITNQLSGNSNQLSSVASELSGISVQQAEAATQLGEVAAISGDQAVSLRNLQVSSAVTNANLGEMAELMHGDKRQKALERESVALMPAMNVPILFK